MSDVNPFRKALVDSDLKLRPFAPEKPTGREIVQLEKPNLTREGLERTVKDLGIVSPAVLEKTPHIADLTVNDLQDLAREFSGVPTRNPKVSELSLEDVRDLEEVFFDFKISVAKDLTRLGADDLSAVDVSCCCCTPCCCCAATDMTESAA